MRALVYHQFRGALALETVPDPSPSPAGVVIAVRATGLCRSDWHGWMGHDPDIRLPHVPGHELAGVIAAVGPLVKKHRLGDRVTVPFVCGCGTCPQCHSGNEQVCDYQTQPGFTHWGSFAEYVTIENADLNVVALPPEIDDATAALLGCRFITAYRAVRDQGRVREGEFVAVHGCGGVGLSAIMIARALGARVIAVDIKADALALAASLGAECTINATGQDPVAAIREYTQGGAHLSLDALGSTTTCVNSINGLRKRGRHLQVGLMVGEHQFPPIPIGKILADELEIIGSHGMQAHRYPEMLDLIVAGKLQPRKLLQGTLRLAEAVTALPAMDTFGHAGVLVIDRF